MRKKWTAAGLAACMLFAGCGTYTDDGESTAAASTSSAASEDAEGSSEIDEFTFIATEPTSLNMVTSQTNLDNFAFYLTQEMLFRPYQGVYQNEVCDSYEVSDDHLTYTYHLKETSWPDGTPITAADFAYYLIAQLDPANGSGNASDLIERYGFVNAQAFNNGECTADDVGIKATDDLTLVLTLESPKAEFEGNNIQIYPLSQSFFESQGQSYGGTAENYQCSGPYILTDWTMGSSLTYEKNDAWLYADEQFPAKKVIELNSTDSNTAVAMFENNEAQAMYNVNVNYVDELKDYLVYTSGSSLRCVQLNTTGQGDEEKAALLSNKNFRLALSYALNRTAINQAVDKSTNPTSSFFNAPIAGNEEDSLFCEDYPMQNEAPVDGDADQAVQYLNAALEELGYSSVDDLPTLTYLTFDNDNYRIMAETITDQWKQVLGLDNIEINLQPIPNAIQLMCTLQYDIYYTSLSTGTSPYDFLAYWVTDGSANNPAGVGNIFSNEEYDSLVRQGAQEFDRTKRMELYAQAAQILTDEAPLIPINTDGSYYAVSSEYSNFIVAQVESAIEINYLKKN
ncbi:MAG: ABC transporter substrate-binding protein [Bulleidia sp.]